MEVGSLNSKQMIFVAGLVEGLSQTEAGMRAGIGKNLASKWAHLEIVQQQVRRSRADIYEHTLSMLLADVALARHTLVGILTGDFPASSKVRAAEIIIHTAMQIHKYEEIERRLSALEVGVYAHR